jgi:hypothetical protein
MEIRPGDAALGIPQPDQKEIETAGYYDCGTVRNLRGPKWVDHSKSRREEDDEKFVVTIGYVTPSPDSRARADEIVAAYDRWTAAKKKKPKGFRAAKRAYDEAERIESDLEQRIHAIQATTIEGMTAKARCCELYYFEGGTHGSFSESITKDLLAMNAGMPVIAHTSVTPSAPTSAAIALIERSRKGDRRWDVLYDKIDRAEDTARDKFGWRPFELIEWRNYSAIGGSEIENARDRFLRDGIDEKVVQTEYRAAKKREREAVRAGEDWDRKVGLTDLRNEYDDNKRETRAAWKALGKVPLTSIGDAVAIIGLLRERMRRFDELSEGWEVAAFMNASRFLVRAGA